MKKVLSVKGMHCASCKAMIEEVAKETKGVTGCVVDVVKGTATIEYEEPVDWNALKKEIKSLGDYTVA